MRNVEDEFGELKVVDMFPESYAPINAFLESSPGWRLYYKDGYQVYRQDFDATRANARVGQ